MRIEDANTPTGVSVIAISNEVTEGEMAKFEIKSDSTSSEARSVNINVDDGTADFIATSDAGDRAIEIPADHRAYILEVPITEDSDPEQHGTITVTIKTPTAGAAFAYTISTYNSATVSVYDDDTPTGISIAAVSSPVAEAPDTYAEFQVIADNIDETNDRTIEVRVENDTGDDFIDIANQDASYNYDSSDNIFDVTIPDGARFGLLRVKIHDDSKYESDGAITATVITTPAPSHNSASIAIENDDLDVPIISISSDAETTDITEGYEFIFEVESDRDLNGTALEITFDVTDGNTGATITGPSVMIPGDARTAIGTVTMPTANVTSAGANIEIEIVETAIYDVSTSDPSITVAVKDNDAPSSASPRMSISSSNYIADGEKIEFTVTASDIPDRVTDVKVMLGGDVNFLADGQAQIIDDITLDGVQAKTFEVDTKTGSASSNHGIITATILEGADYVRPNTTAENETSIAVVDDLPVISISEIANVNKSLGDESSPTGTITFTLTSDIQAIAGYPINITSLSVDDRNTTGPQYYVSHDPSTNIEITNLSTNNAVEISVTLTADNTTYQGWGELLVSLTDGDDYTANTSADTRHVTIIDDQTAPVTVSVSARGSNVEGNDLIVTFEATDTFPAGGSIEVMPTISETGSVTGYYSSHTPNSVTLSASNRSGTIAVHSLDNSNTQANGEVTISIVRGDGFEVHATDHTKVVMMLDDESLPKVSVSAIDTSIDEGQDAIFEFSATGTLTSPLEIDVSVDDGAGNFLTTTYTRTTETIPTTGSINIPYATDADIIEETNGTITVSVLADNRDIIQYLVDPDSNRSSATLSVIDNDDSSLPSVTISAVQSSIIEGDIAIITLTTADDFTAPLSVLVEFVETNSGTGDFFGEASDPNKFTLPQRLELHETTKSVNYHLPTKRDALTEDAGTITARIKTDNLPTKTYSVGANHSVSISVADDDIAGLPSLAIAVKDNQTSFTEGGPDPVFTITSTGGTDGETMNVDIRILQEGNFLQTPNELKSPLFTVGTPLDVAVAIANDDIDEPNGSISATLQIKDPQEYSIGTDFQAIANISDDEDAPEISISAVTSKIVEGTNSDPTGYETYTFNVTLNRQSMRDITVEFDFGAPSDTAEVGASKDYTHTYNSLEKRTLTFAGATTSTPGETTKAITVTIVADDLDEPDEIFTVKLLNPTNAGFAGNEQEVFTTGTIEDDDLVPNISFDSPTEESREGTSIHFDVSLSSASGQDISFSYTLTNGTATIEDSDFINPDLSARTVMIPNGQQTKRISVVTNQDPDPEADEAFTITLVIPSGQEAFVALGSQTTATGTILSDDKPVFTISGMSIDEGDDPDSEDVKLEFDITISSGAMKNETIHYATSDGPAQSGGAIAKAGSDYTDTSGSHEFVLNGDKTHTVSVPISEERLYELDESFTMTLSGNDASSSVILKDSAVGTIENDDPFLPSNDCGGCE